MTVSAPHVILHRIFSTSSSIELEIALLPIGAYHPESFRHVHMGPDEAVRVFKDLRAQWMVPMHYGTFQLSHEPMDEPLQLLAKEAKRAGIQDKVLVLPEGITKLF